MRIFFVIIFFCSSLISYGMENAVFSQDSAKNHLAVIHMHKAAPFANHEDCEEIIIQDDCNVYCISSLFSSVVHTDFFHMNFSPMKNKHVTAHFHQWLSLASFDIFHPPRYYPYFSV